MKTSTLTHFPLRVILLTLLWGVALSTAAQGTPPPIPPAPPAPTSSTFTFVPTADAMLVKGSPTSNFGSVSSISLDGSPLQKGIWKFTVSGVGGNTVTSAKLRLFNVNSSNSGGSFHKVSDSSWTESGITWNNAPAAGATPVASLGAVQSGNWYEVDVKPIVTGDGTISIMGQTTSSDGADYNSKEASSNKPQLVLTVGETTTDTTPPTTPTNLSATAVSANQINLSWTASTDNIGIAGYRIFRGGAQIGTATTNSFQDTTVSPLTTYSYTASAFDAAGNTSVQSSSASATTPALGTVAPLTLTGTVQVVVTLNSPDNGTIHYTTDGTVPTQSSTLYSAPFTVNTNTPVKARAFKTGYNPGPVLDVFTGSMPSSTGLATGARIKTTDYLNVRTSASLTASTLGAQPINTQGTIVGGPTTANGYTWWNVNYDSGPDGWSVQDWMVGM